MGFSKIFHYSDHTRIRRNFNTLKNVFDVSQIMISFHLMQKSNMKVNLTHLGERDVYKT